MLDKGTRYKTSCLSCEISNPYTKLELRVGQGHPVLFRGKKNQKKHRKELFKIIRSHVLSPRLPSFWVSSCFRGKFIGHNKGEQFLSQITGNLLKAFFKEAERVFKAQQKGGLLTVRLGKSSEKLSKCGNRGRHCRSLCYKHWRGCELIQHQHWRSLYTNLNK